MSGKYHFHFCTSFYRLCLDPSLDRALHENDIAALRRLAFSPGGYGKIEVRQKVWPVLIAANSSLRLLGNNGSIKLYFGSK